MIADDSESRFMVGGCFVQMDNTDAETRLQTINQTAQSEVTRLEKELSSCLSQMEELKKILYTKFGSAINLEEGDD